MFRSATLNMSTGLRWPECGEPAPNGTTAIEMSEQVSAIIGATINSGRSAAKGSRSSLRKQLDAVGQRLQKTEGPDARWSPAILHAAEHLALQQHRIGHRRQRDHEDHDDLEDAEQQKCLELAEMTHGDVSGS